METVIGWVLRVGVGLAALASTFGLVQGAFTGPSTPMPRAAMRLGLLILLATPVARVVFSAVGFAIKRDYVFVVITLVVLALLVIGLVG
jgi:uncharacterized membrane protein